MALEEIFEEDFVRSRVEQGLRGADDDTRDRMAAQIPPRTLSPGYYEFALHLLRVDNLRRAGISFDASSLANYEADGLLSVLRARQAFDSKHPACGSCGAKQQNRFGVECHVCGTKFKRKGK